MITSIFNENKINSLINPKYLSYKNNSLSTSKKYLRLKRKRSPNNSKDDLKSIENLRNLITISPPHTILKEKKIETFKFQNFSKNVLSIITSYLRIDDLLKLKNIGSRNIRLFINELFDMMKNNNNYFALKEIKSKKNTYINDYDSLLCKQYTLKNVYKKNLKCTNSYTIKYALYHSLTKKNYYITHYLFYYYFCSSEIDNNNGDGNEDEDALLDGKFDIIFKLPSGDYYEKFQFLDEYKEGEVAIFSLQKILLFNIFTNKKEHIIYLTTSCDHVFFIKELKLLLAPLAHGEIEFFKIYTSKKSIKNAIHKLCLGEKFYEKNCVDILMFKDYINNNIYNNLICIYCWGGTKIIIYDCKLMKKIKEICSNSRITKINLNSQFLIAIIDDKFINYYSIHNNEYSYINSFNLNDICNVNNIEYISLINSIYINNVFILLIHVPNKKIIKPVLLYLENRNDTNDFYYSFLPFKNEINNPTNEQQIISVTVSIERDNNKNLDQLNMHFCHLNNNSLNLNSDKNYKTIGKSHKNIFHIKEYSANIQIDI